MRLLVGGWTEERRCPLACQGNVAASSVLGGAVQRGLQLPTTPGAAYRPMQGAVLPLSHFSLSLFYQISPFLSCGTLLCVCVCVLCVRAHPYENRSGARLDIQTPPPAPVVKHAGKVEYFIPHVSIFRGYNPPPTSPSVASTLRKEHFSIRSDA